MVDRLFFFYKPNLSGNGKGSFTTNYSDPYRVFAQIHEKPDNSIFLIARQSDLSVEDIIDIDSSYYRVKSIQSSSAVNYFRCEVEKVSKPVFE